MFDIVHPIGEVYIQYPGKKSPNVLWGTISEWTDITATYNGAFFRAYKNGTSGDFFNYGDTLGSPQASQNLSHTHNSGYTGGPVTNNSSHNTYTSTGGMSANATGSITLQNSVFGGRSGNFSSLSGTYQTDTTGSGSKNYATANLNVSHTHSHDHVHSIGSTGGTEARPTNYAIKIWERTQ